MIKYLIPILVSGSLASAQDGLIRGMVTDSTTGEPLPGANVLVTSPTLSTGAATDLNGHYEVQNLAEGTYTVSVSYVGYDEQTITLELQRNAVEVLDFALNPQAIELEVIEVYTASRRRERIEDAPSAISVITQSTLRRESNTNLGDYMKSVKGVDFTQSGVDSYNLSVRGFNSSFSSRLLTLTDGRQANVPSLRLIAYNVIPVSFQDVRQIEVVLGPSSALYGPNAHSGVLNIITNSPKESVGTSANVQTGFLAQPNGKPLRKATFRHASVWGNFGIKFSGVAFTAYDWEHFNTDEYEGHDPAFLGRPHLIHDNIDNGKTGPEIGNPTFTAEMLESLMIGEIPGNGIDDNDNGFIDETANMVGYAYGDGIANFPIGSERNSPTISQDMVDQAANDPYNRYRVPGTSVVLWGVTPDMIGKPYKDGLDNNGDGRIDEGIDRGIDGRDELYIDGVDNDGDGLIDEDDETIANQWLGRFGKGNEFGDYQYDDDGNLLFDTNGDGLYGGEEDFQINLGDFDRWIRDANGDDIDDFPDFDVENHRYDIRMDYDPNPDLNVNLTHGYAKARNVNITGIARYLADGWIYQYYQGRLRYKNLFLQSYLNTSYSGDPEHPTRNLATGGTIYDRSRRFSSQIQHMIELRGGDLRWVWGLDYFLTLPDTRGTILSDNHSVNRKDDNGNGEAGSPINFTDFNDDFLYNPGEPFGVWATDDGRQNGTAGVQDNVLGAVADSIDNDGDGLIDEGIDEPAEDNRFRVDELGGYYQLNWKLHKKWELVHATRFDVHDRLTDFVRFSKQRDQYNPLRWRFNFQQTAGVQISPKVGLIFRPAENQNFRLTWAKAFNNPSNQALFLDIFVTRVSTFKVYAKGAYGGYRYPRNENNNVYWKSPYNANEVLEMDTLKYVFFFPAADPGTEGYFTDEVNDLSGIYPEIVHTLELGYKGKILRSLYGTLDLFTSHYSSFVSAISFITPLVLDRTVLTTDYDGDGITNTDPDVIADPEDYDQAYIYWRSRIEGVAAMDTTHGFNPPIIVGYLNYGKVDLNGLDMSLRWFINPNLTLDLIYSYLSISEFINPLTKSKDPVNAPKHKGGLKLQYDPKKKKYSLGLSYRYVDAFPWRSGVYFGKIGPYSVVDLHGRYQVNKHLALLLTINNLFNNYHTEIMGGPKLGRLVMLRLAAQL